MSHIVLTRGVREYRRTIPIHVTGEDIVLEIGCACGTTSARLYQHAGYAVAIDKGKALARARETYPHIHFEQMDGFDVTRVRQLGFDFTAVYIDISGCRGIHPVISMVLSYEAVFDPGVIVVKSTMLKRLVARCAVWGEGGDTHSLP